MNAMIVFIVKVTSNDGELPNVYFTDMFPLIFVWNLWVARISIYK